MNEKEWVKSIIGDIQEELRKTINTIHVIVGHRLSYANEILAYDRNNKPLSQKSIGYETDILVYELIADTTWKPRVVIETKLHSVTTHDAITYSQKAESHKYVHPFLRYGILIGKRGNDPLPGRLFRHGQHFDFMLSWKELMADNLEMTRFVSILLDEIKASRTLEEILFNTRSKHREKYTVLHRPLRLG